MTLRYETRDGQGNDIIKDVEIKEFPIEPRDFVCTSCGAASTEGVSVKKAVSGNFTDWAYLGSHICPRCARLLSLYFYSYIVDDDGIRLLNVRQLRDELTRQQTPPFLFIITRTQKKHLFYRARWNYGEGRYTVNLEDETILTTPDRQRTLFDFVESLQTLGQSKEQMARGELRFDILQKVDFDTLVVLRNELARSRELQIPLFCGQKRDITEEEAVKCATISIQKMR